MSFERTAPHMCVCYTTTIVLRLACLHACHHSHVLVGSRKLRARRMQAICVQYASSEYMNERLHSSK